MKKSKKVLAVMLALIMTLSVTVVGISVTPVSAAETSEGDQELGASYYTMYVGESDYFYGKKTYPYISSTSVSSSNPSVAAIYNLGGGKAYVVAKKAGTTKITITIKSYYSILSATTKSEGYITVKSKPGKPGNLRLRNYGTGFNINWNKASGASRYRVFYRSEYESSWNSFVSPKNYANITYMAPGVLYYVQIRSIASDGTIGGYSSVKSLTHVRGTTLNSAVYNSNGTTTVRWNYASGANGYAVARKKVGDKNYKYFYVSSTYLNDSVAAGNRYTYQVRPFYSNGKSAAYAQWTNSKSVTALFKPTITNMNSNNNNLNINWNSIRGAKKFKVAFKRSYDALWNYRTTTSRYYNVANPTKGATYQVQVCALNGNYSSPYSAVKTIKIAPPLATPTLTGNTNNTRNYLSWNSVSGAKSFQIAKKTTDQSSYTYITTSSTFYYDYNVTKGKTYTYQVRAFNGSTYGSWSNVMTLRPVVDTPTIYTPTYSSNKIRTTWSSVSGASYYIVSYLWSGNSNWTDVIVYSTEFNMTNIKTNSCFNIAVKAVGQNGKGSSWSETKHVYT